MIPPALPDRGPEEQPPDVPGFKTWRGIYIFVFAWFVVVVILLAIFTRAFE